jgi:uncharacterized OB-fold protein
VNETRKFAPTATPETRRFWDAAKESRLEMPHCDACGKTFFYPRSSCPACGSEGISWVTCSGRSTLYSYVVSHRPAPGFAGPTVIAVVELEEGPRMMTNLVGVEADPSLLELDMPLQVQFEERGEMRVPVFAPAAPNGGS